MTATLTEAFNRHECIHLLLHIMFLYVRTIQQHPYALFKTPHGRLGLFFRNLTDRFTG